jgi:HTH-type transcriptional regulator/antitoxin HigA
MRRHDSDNTPAIAIHPGEILKDEIEARSMTQKGLAVKMGRPVQTINMIINGRKGISEDTALDLEKAFDGELTAEMWIQLDTNYRLDSARIRRQERKAS